MKKSYAVSIAIILVLLGCLAVYRYVYLSSNSCIQILVSATNRITGEEKVFGDPCSVPFWYKDTRDYNPSTTTLEPTVNVPTNEAEVYDVSTLESDDIVLSGTGTILDNNQEEPSIGAYLTINQHNDSDEQIFVIYRPYSNGQAQPCLNDIGNNFLVGDEVQYEGKKIDMVNGIAVSTVIISTCESPDYYVKILSGPQR